MREYKAEERINWGDGTITVTEVIADPATIRKIETDAIIRYQHNLIAMLSRSNATVAERNRLKVIVNTVQQ